MWVPSGYVLCVYVSFLIVSTVLIVDWGKTGGLGRVRESVFHCLAMTRLRLVYLSVCLYVCLSCSLDPKICTMSSNSQPASQPAHPVTCPSHPLQYTLQFLVLNLEHPAQLTCPKISQCRWFNSCRHIHTSKYTVYGRWDCVP